MKEEKNQIQDEVQEIKSHGTQAKEVLIKLGEIAEKANTSYLDGALAGLTDWSINAHELNTLIQAMRASGGMHNKTLHSKLILTSARMIAIFEQAEEEERIKQEVEAAKAQALLEKQKAAKEEKPKPSSKRTSKANQKTDAEDSTKN